MNERDMLQGIASKLDGEGFEVILEPGPDRLPPFLHDLQVDLLAIKGDEIVTVSTKAMPGERVPYYFTMKEDREFKLSLLHEAEQLFRPDTIRAALLISWSAFEAIARAVLHEPSSSGPDVSPRRLIDRLLQKELITAPEHETLIACHYLRNALAHGVRPLHVSTNLVESLLDVARRLLLTNGSDLPFSHTVTATVLKGKINQDSVLRRRIDAASHMLHDILRQSGVNTTVEWDLATDAAGQPIVTLTLSDFSGSVSATFEPEEFDEQTRLRGRLYRLFGDLLQIRTSRHYQELIGATSGRAEDGEQD